ncbi:hypothetical protein BC938DRAFT_479121, partial [Jimgerdemannia flammicorona]
LRDDKQRDPAEEEHREGYRHFIKWRNGVKGIAITLITRRRGERRRASNRLDVYQKNLPYGLEFSLCERAGSKTDNSRKITLDTKKFA